MSVIATYARVNTDKLALLRSHSDWITVLETKVIRDAEMIDIDKACDGIVWLLSRLPKGPNPNVEGDGFVFQKSLAPVLRGEGGARESQLEAAYGAASSLSVQQVAELSGWLQSIDLTLLRSRYDPRGMHVDDVYPDIWEEEGLSAFEEYLLPNFAAVRDLFSRAHQAGQQVLVFFT